MKKTTIGFALMYLSIANINAQTGIVSNDKKFHLGIKAGANYANVYDSKGEEFNADGKFGFAAGVFTSFPLSKYVGIQPEILFSQKGFTATGKLLSSNYSLKRTTNYLDIPILLSIKPTEVVTILVGPQYSFLLSQKDVFENNAFIAQQQQEFDKDNIRKNTLCITGGLDFNIDKIVISARAGWDVQNNNGDGTSTTPRYKNAWYQATVGIRL
jgi:hypothetical protein